jgi:hypothetical protein
MSIFSVSVNFPVMFPNLPCGNQKPDTSCVLYEMLTHLKTGPNIRIYQNKYPDNTSFNLEHLACLVTTQVSDVSLD